jgi:hypothetical protein
MEHPKSTFVYELFIDIYDNVIDTVGTSILFASEDEAVKAAKFIIKQLASCGYKLELDDISISKRVIFLDEKYFEEESDKKKFNDVTDQDYLHRLNRYIRRIENDN